MRSGKKLPEHSQLQTLFQQHFQPLQKNFIWRIENCGYIFAPVLYNIAYQERLRDMAR